MKTIEVLQLLDKETKAEVFLVGGFVRDLLRGKVNNDLDVVIRNLPLRNIKRFLMKHGKIKEVTLSRTTDLFSLNILLFKAHEDKIEAQISLPRKGKNQTTDFHNTLRQDVRFRDFKINSLYLPINFTSRKDVIDLVGGKKDIISRRITSNGSMTERIKESPIRMLRAISLASRTNYMLEGNLIDSIRRNASLINRCPMEALREEFNKILMSRKPSRYLCLLRKTKLLSHIAPEIDRCIGVKQDTKYHKYDVFSHLIYTVDNCDLDLVIRLAGILHDIGKPDTRREHKEGSDIRVTFHKHEVISVKLAREFLSRLKYDSNITRKVLGLIKFHMFHYTREWTDSAVRKFITKVGIDESYITESKISTFPLFRLRAAERLGNGFKTIAITDRQKDFEKRILSVYRESQALEIKDLDINGHIIMDTFKVQPGIKLGKILKFLLERVFENPNLNNRLDLLKLTTEYLHITNKSQS